MVAGKSKKVCDGVWLVLLLARRGLKRLQKFTPAVVNETYDATCLLLLDATRVTNRRVLNPKP